ncbi:facilitated trehalose transporter Tret1-like [Drosophila rhopaloa]|uniref:Facilitated trehalose transporter Tret1-like n=1 Tax=Drosophila rhopaloa TaxID=1041015 RepID=A0A6P4DXU9_DRORH|nr:facilitated trehalose transporter Tret1-like [Drosophila rhopaloa]XP_016970342.1 facilitated trehalose transporter Tret1-like [Drosophila rhopaloa]
MDEMGNKRGENIRHAVPFVRQITEDGKPKLEVYRPTTNPIFIWTQAHTYVIGKVNDLLDLDLKVKFPDNIYILMNYFEDL